MREFLAENRETAWLFLALSALLVLAYFSVESAVCMPLLSTVLIQIDRKQKSQRKFARVAVGKFSEPSKMPCYSWSIPAVLCQTGAKLAKIVGSICSKCYALKGCYGWPSTKNAMERRYSVWSVMNTADFIENFVLALLGEIYFRWFDSGDLQSLEMLEAIAEIAKRTPHCQHWLPTKEAGYVKEYLQKHGSFPANLTVRISGYFIDKPGHSMLTGVGSIAVSDWSKVPQGVSKCNAPNQDGECRECRACWSKEVQTIAYLQH